MIDNSDSEQIERLNRKIVELLAEVVALRSASAKTAPDPSQIVREEWQRAVREFKLPPGTPTEKVTARILERLAGRKAPFGCPCWDETDCSNIDICKAVEEAYSLTPAVL